MNWNHLKEQLEDILNTTFQFSSLADAVWDRRQLSMEHEHMLHFYLYAADEQVFTLSVDPVFLTQAERRLIEMTVLNCRSQQSSNEVTVAKDDKTMALQLKEWLLARIEKGDHAELPESFRSQSILYDTKIPMLLLIESAESGKLQYEELKRLLESYFDNELLLVPLMDKEWLILASENVLKASLEEAKEDDNEALEEVLESIGMGLHELIVSEWIGHCHLTVGHPMVPAKTLVSSVRQLREAISLGRFYRMEDHIHFPWQLNLERLLHILPDREKKFFAEQILKRMDYSMDSETLLTLEQFFELDCNVSETAKKMYIHRNTLLYRLDKFKQETGLDVRLFGHAVLVKIAILLYKVTKRK